MCFDVGWLKMEKFPAHFASKKINKLLGLWQIAFINLITHIGCLSHCARQKLSIKRLLYSSDLLSTKISFISPSLGTQLDGGVINTENIRRREEMNSNKSFRLMA